VSGGGESEVAGSEADDPAGAVSEADERQETAKSGEAVNRTQPSENEKDSGNSLVVQVIGNTSLLAAVLIYMGWNYENSLLESFSVPAFSVNIGTVEYALKGLVPLFQSGVIFIAVLLVAVIVIASKAKPVAKHAVKFVPKSAPSIVSRGPKPADWILILGLLVTAVTLPLTWLNVSGGSFDSWFAHHRDVLYFVLALLATGQLLSAWPVRRKVAGPFVYPLALLVAAMCTLWAAGIYASQLGAGAARSFYTDLRGQTAVTVYSAEPLDLSGPGVTCLRVQPSSGYPFRCTGLRLLYLQSGTYDLLPVFWTPQNGHTYILDDSNQIRIELSSGQ